MRVQEGEEERRKSQQEVGDAHVWDEDSEEMEEGVEEGGGSEDMAEEEKLKEKREEVKGKGGVGEIIFADCFHPKQTLNLKVK